MRRRVTLARDFPWSPGGAVGRSVQWGGRPGIARLGGGQWREALLGGWLPRSSDSRSRGVNSYLSALSSVHRRPVSCQDTIPLHGYCTCLPSYVLRGGGLAKPLQCLILNLTGKKGCQRELCYCKIFGRFSSIYAVMESLEVLLGEDVSHLGALVREHNGDQSSAQHWFI